MGSKAVARPIGAALVTVAAATGLFAVWAGPSGAIPAGPQPKVGTRLSLRADVKSNGPCAEANGVRSCPFLLSLRVRVKSDEPACRSRTVKFRITNPQDAEGNYKTILVPLKGKAKRNYKETARKPPPESEPFAIGRPTTIRATATPESVRTKTGDFTCARVRLSGLKVIPPDPPQ